MKFSLSPVLLALITAPWPGELADTSEKGTSCGKPVPPGGDHSAATAVALLVLGMVSFPQWKTLSQVGARPLLMMILGGGVVAGSVGMLVFMPLSKGRPWGG